MSSRTEQEAPGGEQGATAAERLKAHARELGFDVVGIADAGDALEPEGSRLREWLARGMHGEMEYMPRRADERADASRVLAGVRSVVVVAVGYLTDVWVPSHDLRGGISRYAWGRDYHKVMTGRLRRLRRAVQEEILPGSQAYTTSDTGPVLEKAWAVRAGVGWLGKHGNIILRGLASWAFLGVLLVDRALDCDRPAVDRCGTCTTCMDVCPTGAIVAPGVVDARRCISYLTIELRGPIPRELRPAVGQRLYGCDDCQECCPWNRLAQLSGLADWRPRAPWGPPGPDAADVAALSEPEWDLQTRGMALRRAGWSGLRRNALVALGNRGASARPRGVPVAARLLADESPVVRGAAAWALGEMRGPEALAALDAARSREQDRTVRGEIESALASA